MRVTESGRYKTLNNPPRPTFCPICGRPLRDWRWYTVDGDAYYPSLVCYGNWRRPMVWLFRRFSIISPTGAHYEYQMPQQTVNLISPRFDRHTGTPIDEGH